MIVSPATYATHSITQSEPASAPCAPPLALPRIGLQAPAALRSGRTVAGLWLVGAVALALGMAGFAGAFHDVRERAVASPYARLLVDLGVSSGPAAPSQPAR